MPTRLIREGILTSERMALLSWDEEVFFRRLLNRVDDHGLYDARPVILRTALYPLQIDRVREADCSRWLAACQKAGLLVLYESGGKPYLRVMDTRWQIRSDPKYPPPPDYSCKQLKTVVSNCVLSRSRSRSRITKKKKIPPPTPPPGFEAWWSHYPRKVGKQDALKAWSKLKPEDSLQTVLREALSKQRTWPQWIRDGGQFIPHPATWLNGRRWEDQPPDEERPRQRSVANDLTPAERARLKQLTEMVGKSA